jgi:hypothetical protein
MLNVAEVLAARVAAVQLIEPVPPKLGAVQLQPEGALIDTKYVFVGVLSLSTTFWASEGPLLVITTV